MPAAMYKYVEVSWNVQVCLREPEGVGMPMLAGMYKYADAS